MAEPGGGLGPQGEEDRRQEFGAAA